MPNLLEPLIVFILVLIIIFIIDYQINKNKLYLIEHKGLSKQNKKKKIKQIGEIDYLTHKFKLQDKTLYTKRVIFWISIINAFIISFTSTIITLIPLNMIFQLLIAFVLLFALIYSLYEIYGRHLKNIEDKTLIKEKNNISKTKSTAKPKTKESKTITKIKESNSSTKIKETNSITITKTKESNLNSKSKKEKPKTKNENKKE